MTMQLKYTLLAVLMMASAWMVKAQNGDGQNVEAIRIAYLTRQLNLTPEEAQQFWPVYNQAQDELKALKLGQRQEVRTARRNFDTMSDAEVEEAVNTMVEVKQKELDLFMKHHEQYIKVLPIRKVAKLYKAEADFRQMLLDRIKERQEARQNGRVGGVGARNRLR